MQDLQWDEEKNRINETKHNISFEQAAEVFNDENRLQFATDRNGE